MRPLTILSGALALASGVLSVDVEKSVLVTYNREAPRLTALIDQAKDAILKAGGKITHEFKFINGFHAIVPSDVVETIQQWGGEYITVEEDQRVTISS
ncbi:related to serine proteinase inhibitor IA-2 [Cephalotrichum gorgonifer]|uniref:Related to serine proteinase inhibitor IA-2 n=1 Tax=Cephalotrichum gorgonifer TaxID=2041049 RepID=A0AAE8N2X5_9PEZI|nr:related to serine proteinase inhibitor IA-2 [Cephalotrichum gorgonifer]